MQAVQHPAVPRDKNNNALRRDRVNSRGVSATLPAWTTRCSDGNPASVLQQPGDFNRHPPSVDPAAKNAAQPALPADVVSNDDAVVGSAAQPAVPGSAEQPALPADVLSSDDAVVGSAEQPAWYNTLVKANYVQPDEGMGNVIMESHSLQYTPPPGLTAACPGCGAASNPDPRVVNKNPGYCCNKCAQSDGKEHGQLCTEKPVGGRFACDSYDRTMANLKQSAKSFTPAPPLHIPQDDCPLSQQVVYNLAEAEVDEESTCVVDELSNLFMWGSVKDKRVPGHFEEAIESPMRRLQLVLELLQEQRDLHIVRLQSRHDARLRGGQRGFTFTDEDMKEVLNTWRYDPRTWMNEDSLATWWTLTRDEAHSFVKRRFNAMKFTIRCNLIGAVQPAALREFMRLWMSKGVLTQ